MGFLVWIYLFPYVIYASGGSSCAVPDSCGPADQGRRSLYKSYVSTWYNYSIEGKNEELIKDAGRVFRRSVEVGDEVLASAAATYLAIPYVTMNRADSALFYHDYIKSHMAREHNLYGIAKISAAIYYLKFDMNYPMAMICLHDAYDFFRERKDTLNQTVTLVNIANLYYLRRDTSGMRYAATAYGLSSRTGSPYAVYLSSVTLAQMSYVAGKYEDALKYAGEAEDAVSRYEDLFAYYSDVYTVFGNVYRAMGRNDIAGKYYGKAFEWSDRIQDKNILITLYASYADYLYGLGDYNGAGRYYNAGIELSKESRNSDNMEMLLLGLSNTYEKMGNNDSAFYWYKRYNNFSDSIFSRNNESRFNQVFLDYENLKYSNTLQAKELKIARSQKAVILVLSAFIIVAALLVAVYFNYRRRSRMYYTLVEQHQNFMKKIAEKKAEEDMKNDARNKSDVELYSRLEKLMTEDKIYRNKDLSLDSLAEMLCTNRTYLSGVINRYSGSSFHNYVNSYRINEAISMISDPDREVVLKAVWDEIGYNSRTSFYRAFQKETGCSPMIYREKVMQIHKEKE